MLLVKHEYAPTFVETAMQTHMGRTLLTAHIKLPRPSTSSSSSSSSSSNESSEVDYEGEVSSNVTISTVHLESLSNADVRESQLRVCADVLQAPSNIDSALLCGDFNFCSYRNFDARREGLENDVLGRVLPAFVDLWPFLRHHNRSAPSTVVAEAGGGGGGGGAAAAVAAVAEEEKGYTFDTEINTMLEGKKHERMRYDRILFKRASGPLPSPLEPLSIQIVGDSPIGAEEVSDTVVRSVFSTPEKQPRSIFISDHFGLLATFNVVLP